MMIARALGRTAGGFAWRGDVVDSHPSAESAYGWGTRRFVVSKDSWSEDLWEVEICGNPSLRIGAWDARWFRMGGGSGGWGEVDFFCQGAELGFVVQGAELLVG
jgi:hypothetical protein